MSESEFDSFDDEEEDDSIEADEGINAWSDSDPFVGDDQYGGWEDSTGTYHEIQYDPMDNEAGELRTTFMTYEEAKDYLYEIMTDASQYFEIYYDERGYAVYYMGGSE